MNMDSKLRGLLHAYNKRHIDKYATDFGPVPKRLENGFIQNKLCKVQIIKK